MIKPKSYEEILNSMISMLVASTGQEAKRGSVILNVLETVAREQALMWELLFNMSQAQERPDYELTKTIRLETPIEYIPIKITISTDYPKCECGSEKTGSSRHSNWCQKYKENK